MNRAELHQTAAAIINRIAVVPERLTVTEWADRYRQLTGANAGPYRVARLPYHRRPQDLLADPETRMLVLCWASQTGKSTILENGIGYRIAREPTTMVIVRPKIDDAEGWTKERLSPMIRATPALRDKVRLGRASNSTLRYKPFPGGFLFVASAQSATELASRTSSFMLFDEVDRMEAINEGNPVEIGLRRQAATDVYTSVLTSTPGDADNSIIWPYLIKGTHEQYQVPCPHCEHQQPLVWGGLNDHRGLKWDPGKPETARYLCEGCGVLIEEAEKPAMLAAGHWVATNPDGAYPSFHLPALYSTFAGSRWGKLAEEWLGARGKPLDLQVFVNTRLAETWQEAGEQLDAHALIDRLEPMTEGLVPHGVAVLTAGVDVQDNRLEVYVWGWGVGLESWLITSAILPGDPGQDPDGLKTVWHDLDEKLATLYRHAGGRDVPIWATMIDSGYHTTNVYRYTKSRRKRKVFASKGVGGKLPLLGKPSLQTADRIPLFPIGVDSAKNEFLRSHIHTKDAGPAYVHLPDWLTAQQCEGLVAEKRVRRVSKGQIVYEWHRKTGDIPNEPLDCRNYARAAVELLGARRLLHLGLMAADLSAPPSQAVTVVEIGPDGVQLPGGLSPKRPWFPKQRGGWVNNWKGR